MQLIFCCVGRSFLLLPRVFACSSLFQSPQSLCRRSVQATDKLPPVTQLISQRAATEGAWNSGTFSTNRSHKTTRVLSFKTTLSYQAFHLLRSWVPIKTWIQLGWASLMEICNDSDQPVCVCRWLTVSFLLSSLKDKHITMQILLKCKYHIYMLDPQLHICINMAGNEGGKAPCADVLTIKLALMISLPSGHRPDRKGVKPPPNPQIEQHVFSSRHLNWPTKSCNIHVTVQTLKSTFNHFRKLFKEWGLHNRADIVRQGFRTKWAWRERS